MKILKTIKGSNEATMMYGLFEFLSGILIVANVSEILSLVALLLGCILGSVTILSCAGSRSESRDEMYYENQDKAQRKAMFCVSILILIGCFVVCIINYVTKTRLAVDYIGITFAFLGALQFLQSFFFAGYEKADLDVED